MLADFGAYGHQLGMQLPRLDVPLHGRLRLVYRASTSPSRTLSGKGTKPGFEFERLFEGDGSQVTRSYRRKASLT